MLYQRQACAYPGVRVLKIGIHSVRKILFENKIPKNVNFWKAINIVSKKTVVRIDQSLNARIAGSTPGIGD